MQTAATAWWFLAPSFDDFSFNEPLLKHNTNTVTFENFFPNLLNHSQVSWTQILGKFLGAETSIFKTGSRKNKSIKLNSTMSLLCFAKLVHLDGMALLNTNPRYRGFASQSLSMKVVWLCFAKSFRRDVAALHHKASPS